MECSGISDATIGVIGTIGGTIGGTIIGWGLTQWTIRKLDRERQTLDLVKIYQRNFPNHSHALWHLREWNKTGVSPNPDDLNIILIIGNWLEIFATLIVRKRIDSQLVEDMDLKTQIRDFWSRATKSHAIRSQLQPCDKWKNMKKL